MNRLPMSTSLAMLHTLLPAVVVAVLVAACPAQSNDECTGAVTVGVGTTPGLSNIGATTSAGIPGGCGGIGNDVWFVHTATCTGLLTASTCAAANFDTVLQVLGGSCGALVDLGCNDDACGLQSSVTVPAVAGQTYYVRVGSFGGGSTGTFSLTLGCTTGGGGAADDHCTGATPISLGVNGPFSNFGYTTSPPAWPCASGANDRWFGFTAAFSGPYTFQTCSNTLTFDSTLQIFSGSCTALVSLACNDDSCGLGSLLQANLTAGQTYLLRVGGYLGSTGSFDLLASIGNGTGSVALATRSGCGAATLVFSGLPALGSSFSAIVSNFVGAPVLGFGFSNWNQLFCGCSFGADWSNVIFGTRLDVNVPANPAFLNVRFFVQGADLGAPGGCGYIPYTLTDSYLVTIG